MPRVPDAELGLVGYGSYVFHGLGSAAVVSLVGDSLAWAVQRWRRRPLTPGQRHALGVAIDARRSAA